MTQADEGHRIPDDEWATIVDRMPIVSVDLVVRVEEGVLLGKRENEPAKGEWFVPGGRVFKGERRREAVHRVAREELGTDVAIDRCLGTDEHFYDTADVEGVDGKHYVATGFEVTPAEGEFAADAQHGELRVFGAPFPELHPYVEQYLDAAGLLGRAPATPDDRD